MRNAKPPLYLAATLSVLGALGCKDNFHVGTSRPDGALSDRPKGSGGNGGSPGAGGVSSTAPATGGSTGTGGAGGTLMSLDAGALADASRTSPDAPATELDGSAADVPIPAPGGDSGSICSLPADPGPCKANLVRYWYNQAVGRCESFAYGGCDGNDNRFETIEACMSACAPNGAVDGAATDGRATLDSQSEAGGVSGSSLGMSCTTDQDCPPDSRCCDGSDPTCDGTRLPMGDRTNTGQFVAGADGLTVTDTMTGLVWQRDGSGVRTGCSDEGKLRCTWSEAQAYCTSLKLGGFEGWRLPGWHELLTITDLTTDATTQPLDQTVFPGTPMEGFWTSSPFASTSCTGEMYVDFTNVTLGACAAQSLRVRCVRGSRCYPKSRFVVLDTEESADGALVRDTLTGLVWQQLTTTPPPECANWTEGQSYCASLGPGFRLPTLKELDSLTGSDMRVDRTIFNPTRCDYTWTSTPYGGSDATLTGAARCPLQSTLDIGPNWLPIDYRYGVRCVR